MSKVPYRKEKNEPSRRPSLRERDIVESTYLIWFPKIIEVKKTAIASLVDLAALHKKITKMIFAKEAENKAKGQKGKQARNTTTKLLPSPNLN